MKIPKVACDCESISWMLDCLNKEHVCIECTCRVPFEEMRDKINALMEEGHDE